MLENPARERQRMTLRDHDVGELDAVGPEQSTLKQRSVRGAAATAIGQGVRFVLQFGSQVALARLLLPEEFGVVAMVAPLVGLIQLFAEMGLSQAVVQRPRLTQDELSGLFWVNVVVSLALAGLLIAASPLVALFYSEPRTQAVAASLALPLVLGGLAAQPMALMNRRLQFTSLALIDVVGTAIATVVGVSCALWGFGYWSLVVMQAANNLANLIGAWAVSGWRPGRPRWSRSVLPLLGFGGHVTGFNLVNFMSYNIDNVLIGWASGGAALGLYNRAFRLILPSVMQLTTPFTRVTVPLLSRLHDEPERYRSAFRQVLRVLLLGLLPGLVWSIVFATPLMVGLLGEPWREAGPILAAISAGAVLLPLGNGLSWLFVSQGRAREQLIWGAAGSLIVIAAFVVGLPWGPLGVARASAAFAWVIATPLQVWAATRTGPVGLSDLLRAAYPPALAAGVSGGLLALVPADQWPPGLLGLGLTLIVSYGLAIAVLLAIPVGRSMLREIWGLWAVLRPTASADAAR